jgi:hypothetical protein
MVRDDLVLLVGLGMTGHGVYNQTLFLQLLVRTRSRVLLIKAFGNISGQCLENPFVSAALRIPLLFGEKRTIDLRWSLFYSILE